MSEDNKIKTHFSKHEIEFLIKNYPSKGIDFCCNKLNRTSKSIQTKCNRLGIYLDKSFLSKKLSEASKKEFGKYKINPNLFLNINTPEVAYFLGVLWTDGHISKKTNSISISCSLSDALEYKKIFDKIGKWNFYQHPNRKENEKKQGQFVTNNFYIHKFLCENDFSEKSIKSADKILEIIPNNLKKYFFRGVVDGDGCFYVNKKNYSYQFNISSSYEQDWNYLIKFLIEIDISSYKLIKRIYNKNEKSNKSSYIRITKKLDIKKLGDYLYLTK